MTDVARQLLELLDIEQLEIDLFRGIGSGGETTTRIFGGHVIAQALMAAYRTVPDRMCHSLHAYFIRPGDPSIPVIYQVDRARDGGSFTTRRVVAIQHGKQIFNLSASFHVQEEGWDYQHKMPDVKGPEHWLDRPDLREPYIEKISPKHRDDFLRERPIEIREVDPRDLFEPEKTSDKSLRPHGLTWFQGQVMTASLDHAMWFHAPIDFSDWHLYELDAPFTGGARGFNRGLIYNQNGQLAATTAQEGLMRPYKKKEAAS
mgnify:CR=1 FL=1